MKFGVGGSVGGVRAGVSVNSRGVGGGVGAGPLHVTGGSGSSGGNSGDRGDGLQVMLYLMAGAFALALIVLLFGISLLLLPALLIGGAIFLHSRKDLQKPILNPLAMCGFSLLASFVYGVIWALGWPEYSDVGIFSMAPIIRGVFVAVDLPAAILGTAFFIWLYIKNTRNPHAMQMEIEVDNEQTNCSSCNASLDNGWQSRHQSGQPWLCDVCQLRVNLRVNRERSQEKFRQSHASRSKAFIEVDNEQTNCSSCNASLDNGWQSRHQSGQPWLCDVCQLRVNRERAQEKFRQSHASRSKAFPEN